MASPPIGLQKHDFNALANLHLLSCIAKPNLRDAKIVPKCENDFFRL